MDARPDRFICALPGADGEPLSYKIIETATNFAIDWDYQYQIDGEVFTVTNRVGRTSSIMGYPLQQIESAIGRRM